VHFELHLKRILLYKFLHEELISYRCSSSSSCSCWGDLFQKSLHGFKLDQDKTWQNCSSNEYA